MSDAPSVEERATGLIHAIYWSTHWAPKDKPATMTAMLKLAGLLVGPEHAPDIIDIPQAQLNLAEQQSAWRPISEAPRDGTCVLAIWATDNDARYENKTHDIVYFNEHHQKWWGIGSYDEPTHWQPLPAPPLTPGVK